MRRIDLTPYHPRGLDGEEQAEPYDVRFSLRLMLLNPEQRMGAVDLVTNCDLAERIRTWEGDGLLLEEEDYQRVLKVMNKLKGFQMGDLECVRRVNEAPQVQVQEKEAD